jgi:DNA-binding XRE family transcriptional regulator
MRTKIKIPRILKINWIIELSISLVFNNGESRIIDFDKLLTDIGIKESSPAWKLFDAREFERVKLVDHTLSWDNVDQYISSREGDQIKVPFEVGADVLLKYSKAEKSDPENMVGKMIREARLKKGMSQQELALVSGTSRTYISRIENERSDIELNTLRKIIETGLGKRMEIKIK